VNRTRLAATLGVALIIASSAPAYAEKKPRALATDNRVTQVIYSANEVYDVVGTYGYQTTVEFAADESIKIASIGDSIAWQVVPLGNRLFIKPVESNATTNLTVVTDKRAYYFRLSAARRNKPTYLVRFVYGSALTQLHGTTSDGKTTVAGAGYPASTVDKLNFDYQISGNESIGLQRVFDDGTFTYFEFDNPNVELPAIFTVDANKQESSVNIRREGKYMVVERTASQFTLRNGSIVACVFNIERPHRNTTQAPRGSANELYVN
jgi:type IV secretion system protein VirB9